jgi:hypothetical protein
MAIRATFADPSNQTVNLWLNDHSVRPGLDAASDEVLEFTGNGGVIGPYEVPPPPLTPSEFDQATLNRELAADGSVLRALAELTLIEINKLRADHSRPAYTKAQFVTALKAQMRT